MLLCALLVCVSAAAEARASSRVFALGDPGTISATAPLGDGVVWASTGLSKPGVVSHSDAAGTRVLVRFPPSRLTTPTIDVQVVDGQLGVARFVPYCLDAHDCKYALYTYVGTDLLAGLGLARVGGCAQVGRCARTCEVGAAPALAVGGGAVGVYHFCAGRNANRGATVTEADGTVRVLSDVGDLQLAGPWAAVSLASTNATEVVRRADWSVVARLRRDEAVWLQSDGTVVAKSSNRLRIAGPPDWKPRDLVRLGFMERPAGLAAGRVLLLGTAANGPEATVLTTDGRVLRRGRLGVVSDAVVGFDGTRITWAARPCAVTNVVSWDVEADAAPPRLAPCGAPRIAASRAVLRDRRVRVPIICAAEHVQGCSGILRLAGGIRLVDLGPGREAVVPVRMPRHSRRIVRRRGRLRASAVFETRDGRETDTTLTITRR
jgi:hypothetical protein